MKLCEDCQEKDATCESGRCPGCERDAGAEAARRARNARRREAARGRAAAYASVGMVRVRGSAGGTYWE